MSDAVCKAVKKLNALLTDGPERMTQEDIAALVGVEQQTVSQWVRGVHKPNSAEVLAALQAKLGISIDDWVPAEARQAKRRRRGSRTAA